VTVKRGQASVARGQSAVYIVQVSTKDGGAGSVSGVTVALTSRPSSQKPVFTGGCGDSNGSAKCPVGAVSDKQPVTADAQIPVASDAASVTSVKLTATASVTTTAKWSPPTATVTVAVTAAAAGAPSTGSTPPASPGTTLPLGPVPNLNSVSSSLIGAGNASGLFPAINPGATPSPSPGNGSDRKNAAPATGSSAIAFVQPGLTGQIAGLIALAVAVLLTVTRLSLRRRFRSRKQGS
jgi:hypothetical protein